MVYHLAPNGSLALLLANGSLSSNTNNEGEIRKALIEADLVECIVALPGQLFTNTQIPACIWFLTRSKVARNGCRSRKEETLFLNARGLGYMKDRVLRDFTFDDIRKVAETFGAWKNGQDYTDVTGFCKTAKIGDIRKSDYVLTPGRYVGAAEEMESGGTFEEKMARLAVQLREQFTESARLEGAIRENLARLGYDV
jgi:type I restriction enzyme M protein